MSALNREYLGDQRRLEYGAKQGFYSAFLPWLIEPGCVIGRCGEALLDTPKASQSLLNTALAERTPDPSSLQVLFDVRSSHDRLQWS